MEMVKIQNFLLFKTISIHSIESKKLEAIISRKSPKATFDDYLRTFSFRFLFFTTKKHNKNVKAIQTECEVEREIENENWYWKSSCINFNLKVYVQSLWKSIAWRKETTRNLFSIWYHTNWDLITRKV